MSKLDPKLVALESDDPKLPIIAFFETDEGAWRVVILHLDKEGIEWQEDYVFLSAALGKVVRWVSEQEQRNPNLTWHDCSSEPFARKLHS